MDAKTYNKRLDSSISRFRYPSEHFLLIGHGRMIDERSVIQVENGQYIGFGYFDPVITGSDNDAIRAAVRPYYNNPDVRRIILTYLRKNGKRLTVINY